MVSVNILKGWFKKGLKPLEVQYSAWLDSYWHKSESIPVDSIENLPAIINNLPSAQTIAALESLGILTKFTVGDLSTLPGTGAKIALIVGVGMFIFLEEGTPNGSTIFPALNSGVWSLALGVNQSVVGDSFPSTYFVSPLGNDSTGVKGDYTKPFTPQGAVSIASPGDSISFLPGIYTINANIAKNGVAYSTFGGKVTIIVDQLDAVVFDFDSLPVSALDVSIQGDFDYIITNGGNVFKFKGAATTQKYVVKWANAYQYSGVFMLMPYSFDGGVFEGNIEIDSASTTPAIKCSSSSSTEGAGVMNLRITNSSTSSYAIIPWFGGFIFNISYQGTYFGLFGAPLNGGGNDKNVYVLNVKQASGCTTYLSNGDYSGSFDGGQVTLFSSANVNINARLVGCTLNAGPATSSKITAQASNVTIINDQVTVLKLDGTWKDCYYTRTSTSLCVLEGQFYNFQFNSSGGILKITGYVRLRDNTSLFVYANEYLEISGKMVGNAQQILKLSQGSPIVISGSIKQLNPDYPAIKTETGGYVHSLTLKNAVIEGGGASASGISIDLPDGLDLKLYGKSYCNKALAGTGPINYIVGTADDFIVDPDVSVIDT